MSEFRFPLTSPDPTTQRNNRALMDWLRAELADIYRDQGYAQYTDDEARAAVLPRMRWKNLWIDGLSYESQDVVRDGIYTMVANKRTADRAAPQPSDSSRFVIVPDPAWVTVSPTVTYLGTGTRFLFTQGGWVSAWRVWIPTVSANNIYDVVYYDVTDPAHIVETSMMITPTVTGWFTVNINPKLTISGSKAVLVLYAQNDAGKAPHSGSWLYTGQTSPVADPGVGNFNRDNGSTILRINSEDLDALSRDGELAEITPGVEININDGEWVVRVDATTDMTGWWQFNVTTQSGGLPNVDTIPRVIFWEISAPQPTDYVKSDLFWDSHQPSWANVNGVYTEEPLGVGGVLATILQSYVDAPGVTAIEDSTGYGADIQFQPASISPDWEIMAISNV